jgi:hypothetical protein
MGWEKIPLAAGGINRVLPGGSRGEEGVAVPYFVDPAANGSQQVTGSLVTYAYPFGTDDQPPRGERARLADPSRPQAIGGLSAVDVLSVADSLHQYTATGVLDFVDDSVVSHTDSVCVLTFR